MGSPPYARVSASASGMRRAAAPDRIMRRLCPFFQIPEETSTPYWANFGSLPEWSRRKATVALWIVGTEEYHVLRAE